MKDLNNKQLTQKGITIMTTSNFGIVKSLNITAFINEFKVYGRENQFSFEGLHKLYESLENEAECFETNIELDVIALCCEYTESKLSDIVYDYSIDISDCLDDDDVLELVADYIGDNSVLCGTYYLDDCNEATLLYKSF